MSLMLPATTTSRGSMRLPLGAGSQISEELASIGRSPRLLDPDPEHGLPGHGIVRPVTMLLEPTHLAAPSGFTRLPLELRTRIYEELFDEEEEQKLPHPLLNISKSVRNECAPVLLRRMELQLSWCCKSDKEDRAYDGEWWEVSFQRIEKAGIYPGPLPTYPCWSDHRGTRIMTDFINHIGSLFLHPTYPWKVYITVRFKPNEASEIHCGDESFMNNCQDDLDAKIAFWRADGIPNGCSVAWIEALIEDIKIVLPEEEAYN